MRCAQLLDQLIGQCQATSGALAVRFGRVTESVKCLSSGWLGAEQRWTVADFRDSIACLKSGLGFSFIPQHMILEELASGELVVLPLVQGNERKITTSLVFADRENVGPGAKLLAELIVDECRS